MKRFLWKLLKRLSSTSEGLAQQLYPSSPPPPLSPGDKRVMPWVKAKGDRTLRVQYPLTAQSIVWDIGGYEGDWASDIFARYQCRVEVFEPVCEFREEIKERFSKNSSVRVHEYGLAGSTREETITLLANSSSVFQPGEKLEKIRLVSAAEEFKSEKLTNLELVKINIEGGEYELLEHLLETGLVKRMKNIQVQFHDFAPDAEKRMKAIKKALAKTHRLTYEYPWVWESWRRK